MKMYANESKGEMYPDTSRYTINKWGYVSGVASDTVFPEYLTDWHTLVCPSDSGGGYDTWATQIGMEENIATAMAIMAGGNTSPEAKGPSARMVVDTDLLYSMSATRRRRVHRFHRRL